MKLTVSMTALALAAAAALAFCTTVSAQVAYPAKPIRIITPYSPGGTTDILSRLVGPKLTEGWGQPVIVDNRPGGSTVIGSEAMVKSPPDGYTLLCILTSHVITMPDQFSALIRADLAKYARVIKNANIKLEQ